MHEKVTIKEMIFGRNNLARENKTICIENLNVKGIAQNHKLEKSIASAFFCKVCKTYIYNRFATCS